MAVQLSAGQHLEALFSTSATWDMSWLDWETILLGSVWPVESGRWMTLLVNVCVYVFDRVSAILARQGGS